MSDGDAPDDGDDERSGHPGRDGDREQDGDGTDGQADASPGPGPGRDGDPVEDPGGATVDGPFRDPAAGDEPADDPFAAVDVADLDEDAVWAELTDDDGEGSAGESGGPPPDGPGADEAVVDKRSYCERCEYFSRPPEVACTHPGTEIRELVDARRFRVVGCPVVARRNDFEEGPREASVDPGEQRTDE